MKPPYRKTKPLKDQKESSKVSMRKLRTKRKIGELVDMFMGSNDQKMYREEFINDLYDLLGPTL